jgi:hypothetical protein
LRRAEEIGFVDAEGEGKDRLLFNGNLFRREAVEKSRKVLESLNDPEQAKVREFEGIALGWVRLICTGEPPCILARDASIIAEAEGVLSGCKSRLINADATRASIAAEVTQISNELEATITAEARPMYNTAHSAFMEAVQCLTSAWIKLNAAAEAADLQMSIRPSIENPIGHEVLANPRVLEPRIADAVGGRWRSVRGALNRARRDA